MLWTLRESCFFFFSISFTMETALEKVSGLILIRIIPVSWKSYSQYFMMTAQGEALKRSLVETSDNMHCEKEKAQ